MVELSLTTITILAWSKILLVATVCFLAAVLWRRPRAWLVTLIAAISTTAFYLLLSWPLQRMWWANNGDELYMLAFIGQVLYRTPFGDFYYHGLPPFYPPLYFWLTGLVGRLFAANAVSAAKAGVAATLLLWFLGSDALMRLGRRIGIAGDAITARPWFWTGAALIAFFLQEFNDIILKPYKSLPALGIVLFLGLFAEAMRERTWRWNRYALFGISGGLLFLSYYLWWFLAIPVMFALAFVASPRLERIARVMGVGVIMFAVSAVYLVPLFLSYRGGIENWQAFYFVPSDFSTFLPFASLSWRTPLILAGVAGLIALRNRPFFRANLLLVGACYLFQLVSIISFLAGGKPAQAYQPFLWVVTASLAVGAAGLFVLLWDRFIAQRSLSQRRTVAVLACALTLPFWPMTRFIDDPVVHLQIEKDLVVPQAAALAPKIRAAVPDWADRTWLSSGIPEVNGYLPLHYFIAHNPHYSHHAAGYSERFAVMESLAAPNADIPHVVSSTPIDALLLYRDTATSTIPFWFWRDAYPNGGKDAELRVPYTGFTALGWRTALQEGKWLVLVKP